MTGDFFILLWDLKQIQFDMRKGFTASHLRMPFFRDFGMKVLAVSNSD